MDSISPKILNTIERLYTFSIEMKDIKYFYLEITSFCNLNCSYCIEKSTKPKKHMDSMVWKETLDKIGELDSKTVILSGGEPSLHPNLEDIINYAFSKKIAVVLKTNGSLKIDYLFPTLSKGKLLIDISIDSANRQKQDYIRGIGTYNNIIELCKKAYDLREPLLNQVSVLVTKNNYKELNEIIEFAKQYNFRNIPFSFPKEDISLLIRQNNSCKIILK